MATPRARNPHLETKSSNSFPTTIQLGILGLDCALVPVHLREDTIQGGCHPSQFRVVHRHRFDRQGPVGALVLTYEAIRLQPTSESGLSDVLGVDLAFAECFTSMPFQRVTRP
jgi:hypothetical protein